MNDPGRLLEQVGERAPFPNDAFERMLRRRDTKRRNQRLAAAGLSLALVVAAAVAVASFDRPPPTEPLVPTTPLHEITFWFDYDGDAPHHERLYVNGAVVPGEMSNTPQEAYRYEFTPEAAAIVVVAGTPITVEESEAPEGIRGWVDVCCVTSERLRPLYELDLSDAPAMPTEPGSYVVEFHVPDGPDAYFTLLFPIHVAAPEDIGVLGLSFEPYGRNELVSVSGISVHGRIDARMPSTGPHYEFVPEARIEMPPGAPIVLDDDRVTVVRSFIDRCCERVEAPERLYELPLPEASRLPTEPGDYYVELAVILPCPGCQDLTVEFLIPVRVVAEER